MTGAFHQGAIAHLIEKATSLGISVPDEIRALANPGCRGSYPGMVWVRDHPDDPDGDSPGCCWGSVLGDPTDCTCWRPVYVHEQADPVPPTGPDQIETAAAMCGDCAFRKGSRERADEYTEEYLLGKAEAGEPFWCHQDMLRPDHWVHPDGRTVPGSPDDWQPPIIAGIPYRLDGRPGLLCHGWTQRALRARARREQLGECA